ncbi:MAG: UDP-N-acetylglucosamine 2-epimerase (non-hydrolyzing) [Firmicutes bacterium]|nr:UDP-N-acetylglucosamine 2-epimerase (non-hydrolyzing) [Bacillota bacterium]
MKVISVFGTRPEAIKMAPLVKMLEQTEGIESVVAVTAQHREMLDQVLRIFDIKPDHDLDLMRPGQTLTSITNAVVEGIGGIIEQEQPDLLLVHGDTTTTFAAALAAFYHQVPCGHVEAGLRTDNKYSPYPEEMNRRLCDQLCDLYFAPTQIAADNIKRDGLPMQHVYITGNTVIDALLTVTDRPCDLAAYGLAAVDWSKKVLLLTCHRRENWGAPMREIFAAVAEVAAARADVEVLFPMHRNPLVREAAKEAFGELSNVHLCEPLDYLPFSHVMKLCHLVLTDSGGIQEEAPGLGKPVLVLRDTTERPEAVAAGTARLAGTSRAGVKAALELLLDDPAEYAKMSQAANPYGDGTASKQICDAILEWSKGRA